MITALSLLAAAHAQVPADWVFDAGSTLLPDPGISHMATSIGAPTVVYDSNNDQWLMLFETLISTTDPNCTNGLRYGLGAASSPDGITWTPFSKAVLSPNSAGSTFYSCVAAHPTAIFDPLVYQGKGGLIVFFKAEQKLNPCAVSTPTWGCGQYTGFGRLQVELDVNGNPLRTFITPRPVHQPTTATFGFPNAIKDVNTFRIFYQAYPDIVSTSSTNVLSFPAALTEFSQADVFAGDWPWSLNELYEPSAICNDDPAAFYKVFPGGRDTNNGVVISGSWANATRAKPFTGATSWALGLDEQQSWVGNDLWRHWDVIGLLTGDYLVYFSEKDGGGNSFIRMGWTSLGFSNSDVRSKSCP